MLNQDVKVRDFLKAKLKHASVGRVVIERPAKNARVTVFSARPGVVIGKKGEEIDHLRAALLSDKSRGGWTRPAGHRSAKKLYPFLATASKGPVPATGSAEAKL